MLKNKTKKNRRKSSSNTTTVLCGLCKDKIIENSDEASIQCDKCQKWFHSLCAGLCRSDVVAILDDSSLPFLCTSCRPVDKSSNNSTLIPSSAFAQIMSELAEVKASIKELRDTQTNFLSRMNSFDNVISDIKRENLDLKRALASQNLRLQALENMKLKKQLFYKTLKENFNRLDPLSNLIDCCTAAGLQLKKEDFKSAVIQDKMSRDEHIVVKLHFKEEKNKFEILKNKSKIKSFSSKTTFFDVLSRENGNLFKYAKVLLTKGFSFVYHRGGKIYAKTSPDSDPVLIKSTKKVDELASVIHVAGFSTPTSGAMPPITRLGSNLYGKMD